MTRGSTALVESPLQLLGVLEAVHAGLVPAPVEIRWRAAVPGLREAVDAVRADPLPPGTRLVGTGRASSGDLPRAGRTLVVGDAFSGRAQAVLALAGPRRVVLVDDGLATVEAVRRLGTAGSTLVRVGHRVGAARRALGARAVHQVRAAARAGGAVLCTALDLDPADRAALADAGVDVVTHRFDRLATLPPAPRVPEPVVVVGSALVADGLLDPDAYVAWVASAAAPAARAGGTCYVPHRRHDPGVLARVAALRGVRVAPAGPPVELRLRSLGPGQTVVCLPSTAYRSLRLVLAGTGARVEISRVAPHWWTRRADAALRHHLESAATGGGR
ncbi:hypothetical protein [Cellulosimicrobium marinum]|uniref:hypothetical protein n=1 Tax=Cellulosimicrobium marinum TaxID=1638992 RepID=UPI001E551EB5|nr:hypothetical protein [Cellulosimicrobium marinum]MCB7136462.1 hypothetical protein [Cellulosimicrobium marinum]